MAILIPALIGLFIGLTAGMFGIGGALMATPLLKLILGLPSVLALATPLPATIPAALSGSVAYARQKLLRLDIAGWVLITAIPMNLLGAYLTDFVSGPLLMVVTGIALAYSAWIFIQRGWNLGKKNKVILGDQEEKISRQTLFIAGIGAGFLSGFLAIGGGIVLVPTFVKALRLPTKQALATSLLCVAALAIPGVTVHALLDHIDWQVALILCTTVIPMSYLGARIATSLKNVTLERAYGIAMLIFAIFFTIKNL